MELAALTIVYLAVIGLGATIATNQPPPPYCMRCGIPHTGKCLRP
jgi:hypothetical protein